MDWFLIYSRLRFIFKRLTFASHRHEWSNFSRIGSFAVPCAGKTSSLSFIHIFPVHKSSMLLSTCCLGVHEVSVDDWCASMFRAKFCCSCVGEIWFGWEAAGHCWLRLARHVNWASKVLNTASMLFEGVHFGTCGSYTWLALLIYFVVCFKIIINVELPKYIIYMFSDVVLILYWIT